MSASVAVEGYGSTFEIASGSVYAPVAEVTKIGGPALEGKEINVSHLSSPDGFEEFICGMVNPGEFQLELNFTKAALNSFMGYWRTKKTCRVTFSEGSKWDFTGFLAKLGNECPHDDKISMTVTFKVTSKPEFTPAT